MKPASDLVKGVAFGYENVKRASNHYPVVLRKKQYNACGTKAPHIGFVAPWSKYWDEMIEKNQLDAKDFFKLVGSNLEQYKK